MSTSQRGEVSLEFLLLTGMILVIFVSTVFVIGVRNQGISDSIRFTDAQNIVDRVASEINTAARVEGYYSNFMLPEKVSGVDNYSIIINNELRFVQISWEGNSRMSNIVTRNVTGSISPGENRISSSEGVVKIES